MALQSSGNSISFSNIEAEFGDGGSNRNIGKYRVSKTVGGMTNLPLDDGIPQGDSSIAFSDFYGKQLNIIVSFDENENRPPEAKTKYINNNEITVVGGFRDKPDNSSGSKVTLHVHPNKTIGSSNDSRTHCALRTGSGWKGTELVINIGKNALVSGAGGDGGDGGKPSGKANDNDKAKGDPGQNGSSAIGIDYPVDRLIIKTDAIVQAGGGGGGGGGGAAGELGPGGDKSDERVGGAGGGGGQGVPAGSGGEAKVKEHKGNYRVEIQPLDGEDGSATKGGDGGAGGVNNEGEIDEDSEAAAQSGGGGGGGGTTPGEGGIDYRSIGGSNGNPATDGGSGTEEGDGGTGGDGDAEGTGQQQGPGGSRGLPGFAIVNSTGQGSLTIIESGTISGETISAQVN